MYFYVQYYEHLTSMNISEANLSVIHVALCLRSTAERRCQDGPESQQLHIQAVSEALQQAKHLRGSQQVKVGLPTLSLSVRSGRKASQQVQVSVKTFQNSNKTRLDLRTGKRRALEEGSGGGQVHPEQEHHGHGVRPAFAGQ